jgi:hypothetical protein
MSTGPYRFDNDTAFTIEYLLYIFKNHNLPRYYETFLSFHPPLYYVLCALVYAVAFEIWPGEPLDVVRWFSLGCFSIFLVFGCLVIQRLISSRLSQILALALFVSWPLGCFISGRLNNEILMYSFAAIALNFIWKWFGENDQHSLIYGSIAIALAACCKASALSLWLFITLIFLTQVTNKQTFLNKVSRNKALILIFCIMLSVANFGRGCSENLNQLKSLPLLIGNKESANVPTVMVDNSVNHLLTLNLKPFFSVPYYNIYDDNSGRQYFLNSYLKSALFGSFSFTPIILPIISSAVFLIFIIIIYGDIFLRICKKVSIPKEDIFIAIGVQTFFFASFFIRIYSEGNAVSQEFRYGYPCIILFCASIGRIIQRYSYSYFLRTLFSSLVICLIVCSLGVIFSL